MTRRLIWALAGCQFVNRVGGFVQPFLVLYLTQDRQVPIGTAGTVVAAVGVGTVLSLLLGGWLADRVGRRRTMLAGFLGTAAGLVVLGAAETMSTIWVAAFAIGLTSELFRPASSAAVADLLGPRDRVRAYGLLYWAANLGFAISSASAGVLAQSGFGRLFWLNAATSLLAAFIVWRLVPESRPKLAGTTRRALLPVLFRDRLMLGLVAIFTVYGSLYLQVFSTLPLTMTADGFGTATYGLLIALNGVLIVALQPLAIRWLAGRDRSLVVAGSILLIGMGSGLCAVAQDVSGYLLALVVWTFGEIGVAVMYGAMFADLAPADLRGRYLGVAGMTWGLGAVFGPLAGTALLEHAGSTTLWSVCALVSVLLFGAQIAFTPALRRRADAPDSAPAELVPA